MPLTASGQVTFAAIGSGAVSLSLGASSEAFVAPCGRSYGLLRIFGSGVGSAGMSGVINAKLPLRGLATSAHGRYGSAAGRIVLRAQAVSRHGISGSVSVAMPLSVAGAAQFVERFTGTVSERLPLSAAAYGWQQPPAMPSSLSVFTRQESVVTHGL